MVIGKPPSENGGIVGHRRGRVKRSRRASRMRVESIA